MSIQKDDEVILDRGNDITCTVNLHGATITSWRVYDEEQLYVSKSTIYNGRKPILGGISIIFPFFGPWPFGERHGFARLRKWKIEVPPTRSCNGDVEAMFSLEDDEFTQSMWHYPFKLFYHLILLEKDLKFEIMVQNPSKYFKFSFHILLQTFLKVRDVRAQHITGLNWCCYSDLTKNGNFYQDGREIIKIRDWTNRVYQCTPGEIVMKDVISKKKIRLRKNNFPDTIIWNPWSEKKHFNDEFDVPDYLNIIGLQAGHVHKKVKLLPGRYYKATQILQVRSLEGTYKD